MQIHPALFSGLMAFILFLITAGLGNLTWRIRKLEQSKVDSDMLSKEVELLNIKIDNLRHDMVVESKNNQKEHGQIIKSLENLTDSISIMSECLKQIQMKKEC